MSIVMHPLTMQDGSPTYSASDYRLTVNPLISPSNGTTFGTIQGVRYGCDSPLCSVSNYTVTVKPHSGMICPWYNVGGYSYSVTEDATVTVSSEAGTYKVALIVNDPSQTYGSTPEGLLQVYPSSTEDYTIPGIVLCEVTVPGQGTAGSGSGPTCEDVFPYINPTMEYIARSEDQLDELQTYISSSDAGTPALEGQKARVLGSNAEYVYRDGEWVNVSPRLLWSGSWSSGNITVEGLNDYCYFAAQMRSSSGGQPGVWPSGFNPPSGSVFELDATYMNANINGRCITMNADRSGERLTLVTAQTGSMNLAANTIETGYTVISLWGIIPANEI